MLRDSFSVDCWHSSRLDCNLSVANTELSQVVLKLKVENVFVFGRSFGNNCCILVAISLRYFPCTLFIV